MPEKRTATASLASERPRPGLRSSYEILDTAADAMIAVDHSGKMIRAKRMAESVFQYGKQRSNVFFATDR